VTLAVSRFSVTLVLLLSAVIPRVAWGHGGLKSSSPAANSVMARPVTEIRLGFSEAPEPTFTSVSLTRSGGVATTLGRPRIEGLTAVFKLDKPLPSGSYVVAWKTAGKDGHPVTGRFTFSVVNAPDAQSTSGPVGDTVQPPGAMHHDPASMPTGAGFNSESPGYVVIRWLQFVALLALLGGFAFWHAVLGILRRRDENIPYLHSMHGRVERIAMIAAFALLVLSLLRLFAQSYAMHGPGESVFGAMAPMISGTTWGLGWLLQLVGSAVAAGGLWATRVNRKVGWAVATMGAIALAFSPALSGHAASAPERTSLAIVADAIHVIGAGGWLGSLLFVLLVGIPSALRLEGDQKVSAVSRLVNAFSPTALAFAGATVATGATAAWLHIGSVRGLFETNYGLTLIAKLGVLAIVAATGAYNWLRVKPALDRPNGAKLLTKTATVELAVAVLVLAVTAVLVATPTAMDEELMRMPRTERVP
jgi:putative copper export protein/methionine-rich copper-binding protein CopC